MKLFRVNLWGGCQSASSGLSLPLMWIFGWFIWLVVVPISQERRPAVGKGLGDSMAGNNEIGHRSPATTPFSATLQQLLAAKLSVPELARLTNYSRSHVSNIVHGKKTPTLEFARECDEILGTGSLLQNLVPQHTSLDKVAVLKPVELPANPTPFVGRDGLLAELDALLDEQTPNRVAALVGEPGIGKTWLAVRWAHRAEPSYPDGLLFADLHGNTTAAGQASPSAVLANWFRALGVPDQQVPADVEARSALWRSLLVARRLLLVLDNAASAAQVRPLLPGSGFSAAVITSRRRLTDLAVRDGAIRQLQVPSFTAAESLDLLEQVIGQSTVLADSRGTERLAEEVRHHPLRLRLAAERIVGELNITPAELADLMARGQAEDEPIELGDPGVRWDREPPEVNVDQPAVGRIYDAYLGGMSHFAVDREFAAGAAKIIPEIGELAKLNRQFLVRAVQYSLDQGIEQFIDLGSGILGPGAAHQVARRAGVACRVVYVDYEPVTMSHISQTIEGDHDLGAVFADARDVDAVMQHPTTQKLIDPQRPVALIMGLVLHFVPDEDDPPAILADYGSRIAPGSHFVISHDTGDGREQDMRRLAEYYTNAGLPVILRTHSELAHLVGGFELIRPGIVHMPLWRPDSDIPPYEHPERTCAYALVARTPSGTSPSSSEVL